MELPYRLSNGQQSDADKLMAILDFLNTVDGWIVTTEPVQYNAVQAITVTSTLAAMLQKGAKIKLTNDGTVKTFYVVSVSGTTVALAGEVNLANSAITNVYFSYADCPFGFKRGEDWYSAHARRGSTQNLTSGNSVKINLNSEIFDTNNNFDSTTNYRYTAPVSGKYNIFGSLQSDNASRLFAFIKLNGASQIGNRGTDVSFASLTYGQHYCSTTSFVYKLAKGDYLELFGYSYNSGATPVAGVESSMSVQFVGV